MMSTTDVPPYQLQTLLSSVLEGIRDEQQPCVTCAQAHGSEIYAGCSNGELLRFSMQGKNTDSPGSYELLSRQTIPNNRPIDDILIVPSILRVLILCERQLYVFTLPALDMVPANIMRPPRGVVTFAVDEQHIRRPSRPDNQQGDPVDLCIIKRSAISLLTLRERLTFVKDIPLPSGATLAKRTGHHLCVADQENYNLIDLDAGLLFPILPLSQGPGSEPVKPSITVIGENEFLILSWTGTSTLGLFITGDGDPVRGTLEWSTHPLFVGFDYPYISTLLPNNTVEIHSVETQTLMQVVPAPTTASAVPQALISCISGFYVPSMQRMEKLRRIPVKLRRSREAQNAPLEQQEESLVQVPSAEAVVDEPLEL